MIWKRVRTSLRSKQNPEKFAAAQDEIIALRARQDRGEIDLYYGDEAGFSLMPKIPYAWQKIGENIELLSTRSKSFNVLGLFQINGHFEPVIFNQSINSNTVVAYFDRMATIIVKETWIILDNSSIHKAKIMHEKFSEWKEKGLNIANPTELM